MFDFWIFFATKPIWSYFNEETTTTKKNALGIYLQSVWRGAEWLFCSISLEHVQDIKARWKDAFSFLLLPPFSAFSLFSSEFLLLSAPLYLGACATFLTFGGEGENGELRIPPPLSATVSRPPACLQHLFALLSFCCFFGEEGVSSEAKLWGKALLSSGKNSRRE